MPETNDCWLNISLIDEDGMVSENILGAPISLTYEGGAIVEIRIKGKPLSQSCSAELFNLLFDT